MMEPIDRIPDEILREIFPKKFKRILASEKVYSDLKQMILSGRLKRGKRLLREEFIQIFSVSGTAVAKSFSQLKKDRLVIVKHRGLFVA